MPPTLRALIRASGFAGVAGQSFRQHVAGAATGASMRQYLLYGAYVANMPMGPEDPPVPSGFPYQYAVQLDRGQRFEYIQRTDADAVTAGWYTGDPTTQLRIRGVAWNAERTAVLVDAQHFGPVFQSGAFAFRGAVVYRPDLGPFNDPATVVLPEVRVAGSAAGPVVGIQAQSDNAQGVLFSLTAIPSEIGGTPVVVETRWEYRINPANAADPWTDAGWLPGTAFGRAGLPVGTVVEARAQPRSTAPVLDYGPVLVAAQAVQPVGPET